MSLLILAMALLVTWAVARRAADAFHHSAVLWALRTILTAAGGSTWVDLRRLPPPAPPRRDPDAARREFPWVALALFLAFVAALVGAYLGGAFS